GIDNSPAISLKNRIFKEFEGRMDNIEEGIKRTEIKAKQLIIEFPDMKENFQPNFDSENIFLNKQIPPAELNNIEPGVKEYYKEYDRYKENPAMYSPAISESKRN